MLSEPESIDLMSSMNTDDGDIEKATYFVLNVIYNRPKQEKSPRDPMLYVGKGEEKKVCTYEITAARSKSFTMKILRAHLVSHSWINCLDCNYQLLDPLSNGWIFVDGAL